MSRFARAASVVLITGMAWVTPGHSEDAGLKPSPTGATTTFQTGDVAVSGFAGTRLQVEALPPGTDPLTQTVIDTEAPTLRVVGGAGPGVAAPGQAVDSPIRYQASAKDIGHVFGLAFDAPPAPGGAAPTLYAAATSAFGLQIMGADGNGDGKRDRIRKGAAGAMFMPGQFGGIPGAGPGTIYKIDGTSGAIGVFTNVATGGAPNPGPGIGGIAVAPASRTLYASDLDTGLIHAYSIADGGKEIDTFDHGVNGRPVNKTKALPDNGRRMDITSPEFDSTRPETWGYTQSERRIDALSVHDGRLYYAVAEGPQIWSLALTPDGKFNGAPRLETGVASEEGFPVAGIAFDADGHMIVAQRGTAANASDYTRFVDPGPSQVLQFTLETPDDPDTLGLWKHEPKEYAVSLAKGFRAASGGVALQHAFKPDGSIDPASCSAKIVVTADSLGQDRTLHGLQINDVALVRPQNLPPTQSVVVDWDKRQDDAAVRGVVGGVAVLQDCSGGDGGFPPVAGGDTGFPPVAGSGGGGFPPVAGGGGGFPPVQDGAPPPGGGGVPQFPPVDAGGGTVKPPTTQTGPIIVQKSGPATCTPFEPCAFTIHVTNNTDAPVSGVVIDERLESPQAELVGDPNPPWQCSKAAPFTCTLPQPLAARQSVDLKLSFKLNTGFDTKEVKNCAISKTPANAAPANAAPAGAAPAQGGAAPAPGGAAPDPQQQKQLVPGKKSQLFDRGLDSLLQFATFRPQSYPHSTPLLHLAADPGGNIGGVNSVASNCTKWAPNEHKGTQGFVIRQSNGIQVSFSDLQIGPDGAVTGKASYFPKDGGGAIGGVVRGTMTGKGFVLDVTWNNGDTGHYQGDIRADGQVQGDHTNKAGVKDTFKNDGNWWSCKSSAFCEGYADKAISSAQEISKNNCNRQGSDARWTLDRQAHIDFCMAQQSTASPAMEAEDKARADDIAKCRAGVDALRMCDQIADATLARMTELKTLGDQGAPSCKVWSTVPMTRQSAVAVCTGAFADIDIMDANARAAAVSKFQSQLPEEIEKCKAELAKAGGAAAPGQAGGAPAAPAAEPAPDQCTVVKIEPAKGPNLKITKTADACIRNDAKARFECNFSIKIANTGTEPFKGPLSIRDRMPDVDGINIGATTAPPWSCPSEGDPKDGNRVCSKGEVTLAPDESTVLPIQVTVPTNLTSLCVIPNNASLVEPKLGPLNIDERDDAAPSTAATIPNKNCTPVNLAISKTATPECVKNAAGNHVCSYQIKISNPSANPFKGKLNIVDIFPSGFVSFTQTAPGPWTCTSGQSQGTAVSCDSANEVTLAPLGAALDLNLNMEVPAADATPGKCKLLNIAVIHDPAMGSINDTDGNDSFSKATAKIPMVVGPNGEVPCDPPSLKLTKTANPQVCAKAGDGFDCSFDVAVTSLGPDPFHGPLSIEETLPAGASLSKVSAPWSCSGAGRFTCSHPFTDIAVGTTLTMGVTVHVPEAQVKPGACEVNNKAKLSFAAGPLAGQSFEAVAAATIQSPLCTSPAMPAPAPTTVSIAKTALSSSCSEGAACDYQVTITNPTAQPIPGPISFYDTMSAGGTAMTKVRLAADPPAPWTCIASAAPGMQCSHPGPLPANESLGLRLSLQLQRGSLGAATTITNCAKYEAAAGAQSCATLPVGQSTTAPAPLPPPPMPPVATPPSAPCFANMVLVAGACRCPDGTNFNGRQCVPGEGSGGWNGSKPIDDTKSEFPPVEQRRDKPETVKVCPEDRPVGDYPNCCPRGTEYRSGACRQPQGSGGASGTKPNKDTSKPEVRECPASRPVGDYPNCCPRGTEYRNGTCREPAGSGGASTSKPIDKETTPKPQPMQCPASRPVGQFPLCCPVGTEFRGGSCRPSGGSGTNGTQPKRDCGPGYHPIDKPNKYGAYCEPDAAPAKCPPSAPEGTPPNCHCPAGTVSREGFCRPATCGPNMTGTPPNCHRICPSGTVNQNESCVPVPAPKTQQPDKVGPAPKPVPTCFGDKKLIDGVCRCPSSAPKDLGGNQCGDFTR